MSVERTVLDLFKVMVVEETTSINIGYVANGFVTDFVPTELQRFILNDAFKPLPITTLFTVEERDNADIYDLLTKQILHYIEVYGMNRPGTFDLEVTDGKVVNLTFVKGVTLAGLFNLVRDLIYANAPIKDVSGLVDVIRHYDVTYDINLVKNNEVRVALFDPNRDVFNLGDDAVRYMCYKATGDTLLIKSEDVIQKVSQNRHLFTSAFFRKHEIQLAGVFNRHKRIILAAKTKDTRQAINRIARLSKKHHIPIKEPISKSFIKKALEGKIDFSVLQHISVRDKLKYLNLLETKKLQLKHDFFIIRNGKIHYEPNRPTYVHSRILRVEDEVLKSLRKDLDHLNFRRIRLDPDVDYGLPISRKQTMGNLPYGTQVRVQGDEISSGIYWENSWGATDLDLSTVDTDGNRVGWGQLSGYNSKEIKFSGDITYASEGAMEFMTSHKSLKKDYGIFVNIFSGDVPSSAELVVGNKGKKWIENCVIREKIELKSRGTILGFVKNGMFVVFSSRLNNSRVSGNNSIVSRIKGDFWTVKKLLDYLYINYSTDDDKSVDFHHDLSYSNFTYQKLEDLLLTK